MTEIWSKLLFTYGPFALIVFFTYVLEKRARERLKDDTPKSIGRTIYGATWAGIFALAVVVVIVWIRLNVKAPCHGCQPTIRGRLLGVLDTDRVRSPFDEMYIRESKGAYFVWRIVSEQELPPDKLVTLIIDTSSDKKQEWCILFELPISPDFYDTTKEITLHFDHTKGTLSMDNGGRKELLNSPGECSGSGVKAAQSHSLFKWFRIDSVYAQSAPDFEALSRRLEADDPIVRINARSDLAKLGASAIPYIQSVLTDSESSYRLQLGVITALNNMLQDAVSKLSSPANCAIVYLASSEDDVMKAQALRFVAANKELQPSRTCRTCASTGRFRLHLHDVHHFEDANMYLYIEDFSGKFLASANEAEIYLFIRPNQQNTPDHLNGSSWKEVKASLHSATNVLQPGTFLKLKMKSDTHKSIPLAQEKVLDLYMIKMHLLHENDAVIEFCRRDRSRDGQHL